MTWSLEKDCVVWSQHGWQLSMDLSKAAQGLQIANPSRDGYHENVFSMRLASTLERPYDAYVRGNDWVAKFAEDEDRNFGIQLDCRILHSNAESIVFDYWVSVQTPTLSSHPVVGLDFEEMVGTDRVLHYRPEKTSLRDVAVIDELPAVAEMTKPCPEHSAALGLRGTQRHPVYTMMMVHPTDQRDISWSRASDGDPEKKAADGLRLHLFGEFMEKGVLRRARLRYIASVRSMNADALDHLYHAFLNSPLPLDT